MNPYTHQLFLFVANDERGALGQFMRDFGSQLEGFHVGEDAEMQAVSTDGNGPPDGWCFASFTTLAQSDAFISLLPDMPASTIIQTQPGRADYDAWLATFGMQRIIEEEEE
jgi:hypothetical protein